MRHKSGKVPSLDQVSRATSSGKRDAQEDRFVTVAIPGGIALAVMDGHRGLDVAEYCAKVLPGQMKVIDRKHIRRSLECVMKRLCTDTKGMSAGSTISIACILQKVVHIAYLGDSPIIVRTKNGGFFVARDHDVATNAAEREAAIARGGRYKNDGYIRDGSPRNGLQITRALGDAHLGPIILREAEVHTVPLGPKSVVIVCTDGILNSRYGEFERLATEALLIVEEERENPAGKLVEWAHRSTDNKTALVWKRMT